MPTSSDRESLAARPMISAERGALEYVLFNAPWDSVIGNRVDQQLRPVDPAAAAAGERRYLEYLAHSLRSFARRHRDGRISARVNLVEIVPGGLSRGAVREFLSLAAPGVRAEIRAVGARQVQPFVAEARALPDTLYRSPNRLHEAVLLRILKEAEEPYVAFVDPDVTFIADGSVARAFALLADRPHAWAAGFLEQATPRTGPVGPYLARERLHSVAVFFKAGAMRARFPFGPFLAPTSLEERLSVLRDRAAAEHYRTHRALDTFSILTDCLRTGWGVDRIVDLGRACRHYAEGDMLTIVSELLVHSKWAEPHARDSLARALSVAALAVESGGDLNQLLGRASP
jgi:hypothetical protein